MSADRYSVCPECQAEKTREVRVRRQRLEGAYGHCTAEEYERELVTLRAGEALSQTDDARTQTLREEWEISRIGSTEVLIGYSAVCDVCGYKHEVVHSDAGPAVA